MMVLSKKRTKKKEPSISLNMYEKEEEGEEEGEEEEEEEEYNHEEKDEAPRRWR